MYDDDIKVNMYSDLAEMVVFDRNMGNRFALTVALYAPFEAHIQEHEFDVRVSVLYGGTDRLKSGQLYWFEGVLDVVHIMKDELIHYKAHFYYDSTTKFTYGGPPITSVSQVELTAGFRNALKPPLELFKHAREVLRKTQVELARAAGIEVPGEPIEYVPVDVVSTEWDVLD